MCEPQQGQIPLTTSLPCQPFPVNLSVNAKHLEYTLGMHTSKQLQPRPIWLARVTRMLRLPLVRRQMLRLSRLIWLTWLTRHKQGPEQAVMKQILGIFFF